MKKTLTVVPRGGLGNQLHQFLVVANYARNHQMDLVFDARNLPPAHYQTKSGVYVFPFELTNFHNFQYAVKRSKSKIQSILFRVSWEIERWISPLRSLIARDTGIVFEDNISPEDFFDSNPRRITSSLWRISLPDECFQQTIDNLGRPLDPSQEYLLLRKIQKENNVIGVHIRRGDYTKLSHIYGSISLDWYLQQTRQIISADATVFVFSDSMDEAIDFSNKLQHSKLQIVGPQLLSNAVENLHLLSSCSSLVLSNSSFSFWSIMFGKSFGSVVIPEVPLTCSSVFREWKIPGFISASLQRSPTY